MVGEPHWGSTPSAVHTWGTCKEAKNTVQQFLRWETTEVYELSLTGSARSSPCSIESDSAPADTAVAAAAVDIAVAAAAVDIAVAAAVVDIAVAAAAVDIAVAAAAVDIAAAAAAVDIAAAAAAAAAARSPTLLLLPPRLAPATVRTLPLSTPAQHWHALASHSPLPCR